MKCLQNAVQKGSRHDTIFLCMAPRAHSRNGLIQVPAGSPRHRASVSSPPLGGQNRPPDGPWGGLKSSSGGSLEALGRLLAPLEGSLAVLLASRRAPGAGLEASWAQMAPILGPFFGSLFGTFFGTEFGTRFLLIVGDFGVQFGVVF